MERSPAKCILPLSRVFSLSSFNPLDANVDMSEQEPEQKPLLQHPDIQAAKQDLTDAIGEFGSNLPLGMLNMVTPQGAIPIPEAESWAKALTRHQSLIMEMQRELAVIGTIVKVMSLMVPEDNFDEVARLTADGIRRHAAGIRDRTEKENPKKSKILLPKGPNGFNIKR